MELLIWCLIGLWASTVAVKQLPQTVIDKIQTYKDVADRIRDYQLTGAGKGKPYERLQKLGDKFGQRFVGSDALENAIDDLLVQMTAELGVSNVDGEEVMVKQWVRGEEDVFLVRPRPVRMSVMSLGHSVGTGGNYWEADVIVVKDFNELNQENVTDKIVVYNPQWKGYSDTVAYRVNGGVEAGKRGAMASFTKSITDFSLYTPHTGVQVYNESLPKIPHGALTVEDVELMQRLQDDGETVRMKFRFNCSMQPDRMSRNVLAKKTGSTKADEIVLFGGHIDTWDVGTGSMDDGGGVVVSWQVMTILKDLNLQPARTMRSIFWTSEETDGLGAKKHFDNHKAAEKDKMSLAMESDYGSFTPLGVGFTGTESARAVLQEVVRLLEPINATRIGDNGLQADTAPWTEVGVPTANLLNDNRDYFFYHHTHADTMTMMDSGILDKCAVVWATVAYVVAELDDLLPRTEIYDDMVTTTATPKPATTEQISDAPILQINTALLVTALTAKLLM